MLKRCMRGKRSYFQLHIQQMLALCSVFVQYIEPAVLTETVVSIHVCYVGVQDCVSPHRCSGVKAVVI